MTAAPSDAILLGPRRVVVASPMKCGSTYVSRIVARYLDTEIPEIAYDWLAEHRITHELREQLRDRPFVLPLHLMPHESSLEGLRSSEMLVAVQWRNLADTVVSFDDHTRRYGAHNPVFYVDAERYQRMPAQERFRHAIDRIVPWNAAFYLCWRNLPGLPLHPYETMVRDGFAFFRHLLWQLGAPIDDERLHEALLDVPDGSRFNVGVVGRAAQAFDDDTKRRVERHIVEHPDFEELEVLLWELPWEPREIARVSPLDGTTVRGDDERCWFVSRGVRHAVGGRWMVSRSTPALREAARVGADAIEALPEGAPMTL
jgi:hypothetical protein